MYQAKAAGKIFEGEMLINTIPKIILQLFCKTNLYFDSIVKIIIGPETISTETLRINGLRTDRNIWDGCMNLVLKENHSLQNHWKLKFYRKKLNQIYSTFGFSNSSVCNLAAVKKACSFLKLLFFKFCNG